MTGKENNSIQPTVFLNGFSIDQLADVLADRVLDKLKARNKAIEETGLLTVKEVCSLLKISRQTLLAMRKDGRVTAVEIGRSIRFKAEDIATLQKR